MKIVEKEVGSTEAESTCTSATEPPPPAKKKLEALLSDIIVSSSPKRPATPEDCAENNLDGTRLKILFLLIPMKEAVDYTYLSELARKILCITATSVPSEQLHAFSLAGKFSFQQGLLYQ